MKLWKKFNHPTVLHGDWIVLNDDIAKQANGQFWNILKQSHCIMILVMIQFKLNKDYEWKSLFKI